MEEVCQLAPPVSRTWGWILWGMPVRVWLWGGCAVGWGQAEVEGAGNGGWRLVLLLPGVRTCSPFEEGILHAWMGA